MHNILMPASTKIKCSVFLLVKPIPKALEIHYVFICVFSFFHFPFFILFFFSAFSIFIFLFYVRLNIDIGIMCSMFFLRMYW